MKADDILNTMTIIYNTLRDNHVTYETGTIACALCTETLLRIIESEGDKKTRTTIQRLIKEAADIEKLLLDAAEGGLH